MDQILGSTSLHRAARLMRSESSMPTASSCDAMRFLRGRTVHMDPTWIPMKGSKLEEKSLPWPNPSKSTGLGSRQQRGFLNTSLPNYLPHSGDSSNFWPTHPTGSVYRTANTWLYIANVRKYVCLSHMSQTDNSQQCSNVQSHVNWNCFQFDCSARVRLNMGPRHLKSCNLSSKGGPVGDTVH